MGVVTHLATNPLNLSSRPNRALAPTELHAPRRPNGLFSRGLVPAHYNLYVGCFAHLVYPELIEIPTLVPSKRSSMAVLREAHPFNTSSPTPRAGPK